MQSLANELTDAFLRHGWRVDDLHSQLGMPPLNLLSVNVKAFRIGVGPDAAGLADPKLQAVATAAAELQRALNDYAKELRVDVNSHDVTGLGDTERRLVYEVYIERTQATRVHGAPRP